MFHESFRVPIRDNALWLYQGTTPPVEEVTDELTVIDSSIGMRTETTGDFVDVDVTIYNEAAKLAELTWTYEEHVDLHLDGMVSLGSGPSNAPRMADAPTDELLMMAGTTPPQGFPPALQDPDLAACTWFASISLHCRVTARRTTAEESGRERIWFHIGQVPPPPPPPAPPTYVEPRHQHDHPSGLWVTHTTLSNYAFLRWGDDPASVKRFLPLDGTDFEIEPPWASACHDDGGWPICDVSVGDEPTDLTTQDWQLGAKETVRVHGLLALEHDADSFARIGTVPDGIYDVTTRFRPPSDEPETPLHYWFHLTPNPHGTETAVEHVPRAQERAELPAPWIMRQADVDYSSIWLSWTDGAPEDDLIDFPEDHQMGFGPHWVYFPTAIQFGYATVHVTMDSEPPELLELTWDGEVSRDIHVGGEVELQTLIDVRDSIGHIEPGTYRVTLRQFRDPEAPIAARKGPERAWVHIASA